MIRPIVQPARWIVRHSGAVVFDGMTFPGEFTASGHELIGGEGEAAFLAAARTRAGAYKPLPPAGQWVTSGEIYSHGGDFVIARQSHLRTSHAPADIPALFSVHREGGGLLDWVTNEQVELAMQRRHAGKTWRAIQAHVTQAGWSPDVTPSLWAEVAETVQPWRQPTGAHDAYNIGDRVTFNGHLYESLINANVWSPSAHPAGWRDLGIFP